MKFENPHVKFASHRRDGESDAQKREPRREMPQDYR